MQDINLVKTLLGFSAAFMGLGFVSYILAFSTFKRARELMETLTNMAWRIFIHVNMDTEQEEADNAESTDD